MLATRPFDGLADKRRPGLKGACHAHWERPLGRVPRSGCAKHGEARARWAAPCALADVRSLSWHGLGNAVVRCPWQVEDARSLRLYVAPANFFRDTSADTE